MQSPGRRPASSLQRERAAEGKGSLAGTSRPARVRPPRRTCFWPEEPRGHITSRTSPARSPERLETAPPFPAPPPRRSAHRPFQGCQGHQLRPPPGRLQQARPAHALSRPGIHASQLLQPTPRVGTDTRHRPRLRLSTRVAGRLLPRSRPWRGIKPFSRPRCRCPPFAARALLGNDSSSLSATRRRRNEWPTARSARACASSSSSTPPAPAGRGNVPRAMAAKNEVPTAPSGVTSLARESADRGGSC